MQSTKLRTPITHPRTLRHALLKVSPHWQHPAQSPCLGQQDHRGAVLDEGPEDGRLLDVDGGNPAIWSRKVLGRGQENGVSVPMALGAHKRPRSRGSSARPYCLRCAVLREPGPFASNYHRGERPQGRQPGCEPRQANSLPQGAPTLRGEPADRRAENARSGS